MAKTTEMRTVVEHGPKDKKCVAFAVDWPGLSRGGKRPGEALETLESYLPRYRPVAAAAGRAEEFDGVAGLDVVEDRVGPGSTDFWGISFSPCSLEAEPMPDAELERKIGLLQACWAYLDGVAARVSPAMRKGVRGGGRDRDEIVGHVLRTETHDFAKRLGLRTPEDARLSLDDRQAFRDEYVGLMREYNAGESKRMRSWNLPFLIRHTAFHTMDHAWEMEDKDLAAEG
ncbi:MAG: hypothetical protein ACTHMW_14420 [Actinomycetes bacterium]